MSGAIVLLVVNSAVAAMFALCYFLIALIGRAGRPITPFGFSYMIGMVTPLAELMVRVAPRPVPFMVVSYISLLAGFLAMSAALSAFARERPQWGLIAPLAILGICARALIWDGTRDRLPYELAYQAPFVLALLLCTWTALRHAHGRPLHYALSALFGVIALNFLLKPFVAAALGSGATAKDYAASAYALFSQASTGILLIAAGLVILLIVIHTTIHEHILASETDHLSGLLNRRGFDRKAEALLESARHSGADVSVVMIDLDHFKTINDTHGHDIGDRVIRAFAATVRNAAPQSALLARTGGEEFVALLSRTTLEGARLITEALRQQSARHEFPDVPDFTFSAGVAQFAGEESLSELMRRADQAAYRAKLGGRDRTELDRSAKDGGKVLVLRPAPLSSGPR